LKNNVLHRDRIFGNRTVHKRQNTSTLSHNNLCLPSTLIGSESNQNKRRASAYITVNRTFVGFVIQLHIDFYRL